MKQLYGKLWVKCTAIALLVVFAVLFAAAALGSAYLICYGAFADGGEQVRQMAENNLLQQTRGDGWTAMHAWAEDDTVTGDLLRERYDPLTSNIYFKLTDKDTGEILFSTGKMPKDDYTGKASAYYQQDMTISLRDGSDVTALYQAYLKSPLAPRDSALYVMTWVERLINARYQLIVLAVFLLAVCLFLFIFLLCSMGRKEGVDGIYQCWLNKIPLDLFLALLVLLFFAWATFLSDIWYIDFWYYILLAFGAAALVLTLVLSVAGRAKAPGFFRNTVIYKLFLLIFRTLGRIPMVWRTMLIWVCWCFVDLYFTFSNSYYYDSLLPAFWVISRAVLTIVIYDRTDFVESSSKIWKLCEVEKIDGYISALSIPNIVYILRKELTPEKTQQIIEQLFMIFHIADLKSSDIRKAANMKTSDYEDAIQMVCAQRMKVDFIVTRNIKDFIESKVPAMKPDELLERI